MAEPQQPEHNLPLNGLHLLVTRPEDQAIGWLEQIQQLGATTTWLPALTIEPVSDTAQQQAIIDHVLKLDEYQWGIFVSQNAVKYGCDWIDRYWPQLPMGFNLLAVGQATASSLQHTLGDLAPEVSQPGSAMNSEALLALPELQKVAGCKILIFRGVGGRPLLGEELQARGAQVDYCELYHRQIPVTIDEEKWAEFRKSSLKPVTVAHSGEALTNLLSLLKTQASAADNEWLRQQALLVPGERVAHLAKTQGFEQIIIAENATHQSMIGALNDWRQR